MAKGSGGGKGGRGRGGFSGSARAAELQQKISKGEQRIATYNAKVIEAENAEASAKARWNAKGSEWMTPEHYAYREATAQVSKAKQQLNSSRLSLETNKRQYKYEQTIWPNTPRKRQRKTIY